MHKYKVLETKALTPTVQLLTLISMSGEDRPILYQPGQYAAISLNDHPRPTPFRCFSITSSPVEQGILQFSIRIMGTYTQALKRLEKDDEIIVMGPFGRFVFNQYIHDDLVLFAGGIGIAPFISMIRYASGLNLKNKIKLVYSCRDQSDIPFYEELCELEKINPNLEIVYVIGKPPIERLAGKNTIIGKVDNDTIEKLNLKTSTQTYMICGPAPYMAAISSILETKGAPKDRILTEAFSQGSKFQKNKLKSWPIKSYFVAGISFVILAFFIIFSDLNKTLPEIASQGSATSTTNNVPTINSGNLLNKINSLGPQVDTKTTQEPIVKTTTTTPKKTTTPTKTTTTTTTVITKPKTTTPTPVTTTPVKKPKTRTS